MTSHSRVGYDPDFREHQSLSAAGAMQTLKDHLMVLHRHLWLIAAITLVLFSLIAAYVFKVTPLYTSTLGMVLEGKPGSVINLDALVSGSLQDEGAFLAEIEILKSRRLAERVVKTLALDTDPEFNTALQEQGPVERAISWAKTLIRQVIGSDTGTPLSEAELRDLQAQQIVDAFLERLDVSAAGRSRVVLVSFTSESPTKAVRMANALAEQYLQMQFERSFDVSRRASTWLAGRIDEMRAGVEEVERTIASYRKTYGLLQGQQNEPLINEQISDLNARLTEASMERIKAESILTQVNRDVASRDVTAVAKVLESALVQRFREQELDLARKEAELSRDLGPRHPRAIQLQEEKRQFRATVDAEVQKLVRSLENEVTVARAREKALTDRLNSVKAELATANRASAGLNSLERTAASDKLLLDKFLTARSELVAKETDAIQSASGYVMSPAVIPTGPSYPRKTLMLAGGLAAALLLASILAFLIEGNDTTFRNAPQVETLTGVPVLSLVPSIRTRRSSGQIVGEVVARPHSRFAEAIRGLYTRLALAGPASKLPWSLLFLSAHPGEGKTTIALSTARLIASQTSSKVLFIDADLRRSGVAHRVGLEPGPGLQGVLSGRLALSEAAQKDPISPLHLLLSGQELRQGLMALPRDRLQTLLNTAKKEYDLIVIDSAPLFALSDPHLLAAMADATILVVRWGRTPRKVATYALDQLTRASGKVAGIVLSRVRLDVLAKYGEGDAGYYEGGSRQYYTA